MNKWYNAALKQLLIMDIVGAMLNDEQAITVPSFYRKWEKDFSYNIGDRCLYNDTLYSCLTSHTSQADWTPDVASSLWTKILIPGDNNIYPWEQPDSTNPYSINDKVTHNGNTWISIVDNNVWEPGVYGWEIIEE